MGRVAAGRAASSKGGRLGVVAGEGRGKGPGFQGPRPALPSAEEDIPGDEQWLLVTRHVLTGEVKYFLAKTTPLRTRSSGCSSTSPSLAGNIERIFREANNEQDLDHYEGRRYLGQLWHLTLTALGVLFLVEQKQRFAKEDERGRRRITLKHIKRGVEAQLDPGSLLVSTTAQLTRALRKIRYHQRRNADARRYHHRTRRKRLKRAGIDHRQAKRCPETLVILS